ncbi:MAG: winged helix-turn-helix domain-containing protein [Methanophagales archaeon]|nr:winged helix-turn-helix domain-containing protein [Methanophagales archaeon]
MVTASKRKNTQDTLRLATCSALRRDILIYLEKGKKPLSAIRDTLGVSSTTAIHALRDLEKDTCVFQDENRNYALTKIGELIALKLTDFIDAITVLKNHKEFWLTHDLSGIPEHLLGKIGWLSNSNIVNIDALDIIKAHRTYMELLTTARWIKGGSPIFSPDYPEVFEDLAKRALTQLVLTENVLKKVIDTVGSETIKSLILNHHLEFFVTEEEVKVAFTVTDTFLSFGLFKPDGIYDTTLDLISTEERAIRWGIELFEYYREKAKKYEV